MHHRFTTFGHDSSVKREHSKLHKTRFGAGHADAVPLQDRVAAKRKGNAFIFIAMGLALAFVGWFTLGGDGVIGVLVLFGWATYAAMRPEGAGLEPLPHPPGGLRRRHHMRESRP